MTTDYRPRKMPKSSFWESDIIASVKIKPTKIVAVGLNYRDHASEMKAEIPAAPVLFLKPPSSVIFNNEAIFYPPQTKELHYEAELAVVIKDRIKNISEEEAAEHILGYTCANDVTARDLQRLDGQWTRAKSFDTFCPLGPEIVPGLSPDNLAIKLFLNGEQKQASSTSNLIFKVDYLVAFISQVMTLLPEDVILTGTPAGIGPMRVGDEVAVEIEGIGRLVNKVKEWG
jgi:2-keto-4-pentenoate hydratase/2-oxohepta-3-ene-1,7-dioic acid hydratase in catechol pathway